MVPYTLSTSNNPEVKNFLVQESPSFVNKHTCLKFPSIPWLLGSRVAKLFNPSKYLKEVGWSVLRYIFSIAYWLRNFRFWFSPRDLEEKFFTLKTLIMNFHDLCCQASTPISFKHSRVIILDIIITILISILLSHWAVCTKLRLQQIFRETLTF